MGLDNSKKYIFCIEKHSTFADEISENRLHLSNSSELDCIRFALSLHRRKDKITVQRHSNIITNKKMKKRIIYVGTLIDLAAMFEPDVEAESIEVTNIIKYESNE